MYSAVWKDTALYTGCDQKLQHDGRLMFCADNRRVLRAIDLAPFSIFDLNSYGSPWVQAIIIADRPVLRLESYSAWCLPRHRLRLQVQHLARGDRGLDGITDRHPWSFEETGRGHR